MKLLSTYLPRLIQKRLAHLLYYVSDVLITPDIDQLKVPSTHYTKSKSVLLHFGKSNAKPTCRSFFQFTHTTIYGQFLRENDLHASFSYEL